jgi:hypothetical protein
MFHNQTFNNYETVLKSGKMILGGQAEYKHSVLGPIGLAPRHPIQLIKKAI